MRISEWIEDNGAYVMTAKEVIAGFILAIGCGVIIATAVFTCVIHKPGIGYVQNTEYRDAIKVNIDGRLTTLGYKVRFP